MIESNPKRIIFTVKPEFLSLGLKELHLCDPESKTDFYIDDGVGVMTLSHDFQTLSDCLKSHKPIFLQHICPIHIALKQNRVDNLKPIVEAAQPLIELIDRTRSFSVQTRVFAHESPFKGYEVNEAVAAVVSAQGITLDVTDPEQVISIAITEEDVFLGISSVTDNISSWAGGKHRLAHEKGQISRAEFKLIEAIKVFGLILPKKGLALDLGAAPGGWTRVLLNHHLQVIAVDPAKLDKSIKKHPKVKHYRETAQKFFHRNLSAKFDVIVNDMKMDTHDSVNLINLAYDRLKKGGFVVLTLKLPKSGAEKKIVQAIEQLENKYAIEGIKQLFHNRSEVTVILKK
ncbi:MAG: SAM-dependent methyltransferase [Tuberibacillus sp.]